MIYLNGGNILAGTVISPGEQTLPVASLESIDNESYIKVINGHNSSALVNRSGLIITGVNLQAGNRYLFRAKGYQSGGTRSVTLSASTIHQANWSYKSLSAVLPYGKAAEGWIEMIVDVAEGAPLELGITWEENVWVKVGPEQSFYINDIEVYKLSTQAPEYQYNLKDHLGNVRVTFTTKDEIDESIATLEAINRAAESGKFLRYDRVRIINSSPIFDHTNGLAEGSSIRLSGNANEKTGLVRSLSVMPGDVINMEVYAKYIDTNPANWNAALATLMNAITAGSSTVVTDGGAYTTNSTNAFPFMGLTTRQEARAMDQKHI